MRLRLLLYALAAALLVHFTACKKSNTLPEPTQTGAGTFGCKVNGEVFMPKNKLGYTSYIQSAYEYINDIYDHGYFFQLNGGDLTKSPILGIGIYTDSLPIHEGVFELKSYSRGNAYGVYGLTGGGYGSKNYYTSDNLPGRLVITKLDESKQIVSGTFNFKIVTETGDTIVITEGRFDTKYTR